MAHYNSVDGEFWADTAGWPDDQRVLALYLLTCEHRVTEGLFKMPPPLVGYELGSDAWPLPRVEKALRGLVSRSWLVREASWVCIANCLRYEHNRPASPSQMKGAVAKVDGAPRDGEAWATFVAGAERWAPVFADVLTGRKIIVRSGDRGLKVVDPPTSPVTTPPTGTSVPPSGPSSGPDLSPGHVQDDPPQDPRTSSNPLSLSNSTSFSPSLPAVPESRAHGASAGEGSGRQAGADGLDDFVAEISRAALRGPSEILKAQATDRHELGEVRAQLALAGPRARAATGHVVEWLSRRGAPLNARRLSALTRSAVEKVPAAVLGVVPDQAETFVVHPEADAAWQSVLAELADRSFSADVIDLWLAPLRGVSIEGDALVLAGSAHIVNWVRARAWPSLEPAAGRPVRLVVGVVTEAAA